MARAAAILASGLFVMVVVWGAGLSGRLGPTPITLLAGLVSGAAVAALLAGRPLARAAGADAHEELLRSTLELAPDAVITVDADGHIVLVNRQAEQLFGYRCAQMVGQPVEMLLPERVRHAHLRHRLDYSDDPRTRPMGAGQALTGRRSDGQEFPAEISLSPIRTPRGLFVATVVRDVTEKKRTEAHLAFLMREESARVAVEAAERRAQFLAQISKELASSLNYETTLSSIARLSVPELADWCTVDIRKENGQIEPLAVAHVDPARRAWAQELRQSWRIDPDAPHGVANVIRTGRAEFYHEVSEDLLRERTRDPDLAEALVRMGLRSAMIVPLMTRRSVEGAITFISTSESNRLFAEADLALAQEVASRAAMAIENAQSYREAQDANRQKDEFLATLSHELRTPLNAIIGWTHLLKAHTPDAPTLQRGLAAIDRNSRAQVQLIEDILEVSRIITGKLVLHLQPLSLGEVVRAVYESLRPSARARHVRLDWSVDQAADAVVADPARLQQVIWNLLSNAIKFTPDEGVVVLGAVMDGGNLVLTVADTGAGISPDFLPHVFERFRQGDSSLTRAHGGLGLGLAIVRHLVELHGGTVAAESPGSGHGATFTVRLPVDRLRQQVPAGGAGAPAATRSASEAGPGHRLAGLRVLVVDDDADSRDVTQLMLEDYGARVGVADSAADALDMVDREHPDVLIVDIGMPGEDGYSLLRKIRQRETTRTPAIAVTAYVRDEDRTRSLRAGFGGHLGKPVAEADLIDAVALAAGRPHDP
jgi:PAS domain S-box-containing protein